MQESKAAVFPVKKIATKVKHKILQNCLKAWGGIIIASNPGRSVRLSFVDTCCGSGLYASENDADVEAPYDTGSAIIGIEILNELLAHAHSLGREASAKALIHQRESR
jgi:hypothetical protein